MGGLGAGPVAGPASNSFRAKVKIHQLRPRRQEAGHARTAQQCGGES
jgi:hypothetical protein